MALAENLGHGLVALKDKNLAGVGDGKVRFALEVSVCENGIRTGLAAKSWLL